MWRESHLSTHVLWQSASGISEPAWPLLLHMTPQCIGATSPDNPDQAPTVLPHMPGLSLRDTALSKEIHCMHEQQPKHNFPAQWNPEHVRSYSIKYSAVHENKHWCEQNQLSVSRLTIGWTWIIQTYLAPKWVAPQPEGNPHFPTGPSLIWHLWFRVNYRDTCWTEYHEILEILECSDFSYSTTITPQYSEYTVKYLNLIDWQKKCFSSWAIRTFVDLCLCF